MPLLIMLRERNTCWQKLNAGWQAISLKMKRRNKRDIKKSVKALNSQAVSHGEGAL